MTEQFSIEQLLISYNSWSSSPNTLEQTFTLAVSFARGWYNKRNATSFTHEEIQEIAEKLRDEGKLPWYTN